MFNLLKFLQIHIHWKVSFFIIINSLSLGLLGFKQYIKNWSIKTFVLDTTTNID